MKSASRNRLIALLMIVSEIMIIGLVSFWLVNQFRNEENELRKELYAYYKESYNAAIDSLLIDFVIKPALGEEVALYRNYSHDGNVIHADSLTFITARLKTDSIEREDNKQIKIELSTNPDSTGDMPESNIIRLRDSVLLRSVKLVVSRSADSITSSEMASALRKPDREIFIREYSNRLTENNLDFDPVWINTDSLIEKHNKITLKDWTGYLPSVIIRKHSFYLIGEILPQIIFSILLALVSCLAFVLSYKSILKQTKLNELRNSFISNISHELKTPVSTVKVAIEALRSHDKKQSVSSTGDYLEMAGKEIRRLEILINKVLDHSVIEENTEILNYEKTDLAELTDEVLESLQSQINSRGATLSISKAGNMMVEADPLYLQSVLMNVLDNSLKYAGERPVIRISLKSEDGNAKIDISDNGPGIPDEYRNKIFEKFFRVPHSDIHNVKGYGLGLSFARQVVELHGGEIKVNNTDEGCVFKIVIPLKRP